MSSPAVQVKDGSGEYVATDEGVDVTSGNTVTIKLTDTSVRAWLIECATTDELGDAASVTSGLTIDALAKTATFTAGPHGRCYRFRSLVENGFANGVARSDYETYFTIYVPTENGDRVHALDETTEGGPFGYGTTLNRLARKAGVTDTDNSEINQVGSEITTSNATPTTIGSTFALPTDSITTVDAQIACIRSDGARAKIFNVRRHFLNDGGAITASAQTNVAGPDELGGALAASVAIAYTGTTARLEVTGVAATTLRWRVDRQTVRVTAPEAAAPGAFDPLTLPGASATPMLWLDASDCTNGGDGTPVTAVNDKAGGTMTIGVTGNEPTFQAANPNYGGGPTFDCATAQGFILTNTGLTGQAFTLVLVCDGTDNVWMNDGNGNYLVNAGGGSGDKLQSRADGAALLVGATAVSGVPGVYVAVFDGASSKLYTSAETPDATGDAGTNASLAGTALGLLGAYNMSGSGLMGSCRHALIYEGAMSASDVAFLLNGFGDESGISIGG